MHINQINNINLNSLNITKTRQIKNQSTPIKNIDKEIGLQSLPFHYPISFGSAEKLQNKDKLSFYKTVEKYFRFTPDKYQLEAGRQLYNNEDSLVLAPTGTGKTLIAEYVINKNLSEGKRTFYTTPLKALSNEKYTDFCKLFGKENVGLLTGDIKLKPDAPVVIMTTEIYRNILLGENEEELQVRLDDLSTIVFDEFHYMNDEDRGEVWETSIMYTPENVQKLLLSATAGNGEVVNTWMQRLLTEKTSTRQASIVNVPPEERHVPLRYYVFDPQKSKTKITPLVIEYYNLKRLEKALRPDNKYKLTDKQIAELQEISKRANKDGSVESAIEYLKTITDLTGKSSALRDALINNLGYERLAAERTALILSNPSSKEFNDSLKDDSGINNEQKRSAFSNGKPQKIISRKRVNEAIEIGTLPHKTNRALMQFSRAAKGNTTVLDGLQKIKDIIGKDDMSVKDFEKRLQNIGLKKDSIDAIVKSFSITINPKIPPVEFDLISVLQKEDKLPAIFFNFSKKKCENLKNEFLKSSVSLLTDEEKEKATEIIKKHTEKDAFFGTDEDVSSLLSGVAVHHAGKMPSYKALVEELSQNKLLKVVFATSTLGAGINVPAKTVVFTQLTRYAGENGGPNGEKFVTLGTSELLQMAGRGGRRGKDPVGNVIFIPDKEHRPMKIFKMITSPADEIESSFKPTYSFISHFISQNGTTKNLESAVDKSFLKERLESLDINPIKTMKRMKKQFTSMANVLTTPVLECFEEKEGKLIPTIKGQIVSKARGINGIFFAETVLNQGLQYLTPEELATVACTLNRGDFERESEERPLFNESVSDVLSGMDIAYKKLQRFEHDNKLEPSDIVLDKINAQYIEEWVNAKDENSREGWEKLIKRNSQKSALFNEGDFLKIVNRTIDIVEQIKEVSEFAVKEGIKQNKGEYFVESMKTLNKNAKEALKLLKRDPVQYEL